MAKTKLTVKQAKLVKGVAEGKTKRQAAIDAGYSGSPETVSVTASDVLKKPNVQEALYAALERAGLTPDDIMNPVANALKAKVRLKSIVGGVSVEMDAPDLEMNLKGHDRAMKIIQPRNNEGTNVNINFNNIAKQDKDEFGI